jgi:dUTP pyrophosphatase
LLAWVASTCSNIDVISINIVSRKNKKFADLVCKYCLEINYDEHMMGLISNYGLDINDEKEVIINDKKLLDICSKILTSKTPLIDISNICNSCEVIRDESCVIQNHQNFYADICRGIFDACAVYSTDNIKLVNLHERCKSDIDRILPFAHVNYKYMGPNMNDILAFMCDKIHLSINKYGINDEKIGLYSDECIFHYNQIMKNSSIIKFKLMSDMAVAPNKRVSDTGYDLTVVREVERIGCYIKYSTDVAIEPANNVSTLILPKSSIYKHGIALANSIGLIDSNYRGTLDVIIYKVNPNAPDIKLPCTFCQLVPFSNIHTIMEQVEILNETVRGSGGFGSTSV